MTIESIFTQIMATIPARRGNVYNTMVKKRRKDGSIVEYGPYAIWTRYENGKMKTSYVPRGQEDQYRMQVERGNLLDKLIEEIWGIAEKSCDSEKSLKKKLYSRK